ncbi:MAG: GntR family transcriptional regulator [Salinicola sp.]|nr:GntR family transcriptional regulator [Salinicola sp.]
MTSPENATLRVIARVDERRVMAGIDFFAGGGSRLYRQVGEHLLARLNAGEFAISGRLPSEKNLCEAYDVSRTVIREALIMLEVKGKVEIRKGSGVHVVEGSDANEELDHDIGPFELLQARQILESSIARLAARTAGPRDIARLETALALETQEFEQGIYQGRGDFEFHLGVAEATQNSLLIATVHQLWKYREKSPMWQKLQSHIENKQQLNYWVPDHRRILDALSRRDATLAESSMSEHLEHVREMLFELSDIERPDMDRQFFALPAR